MTIKSLTTRSGCALIAAVLLCGANAQSQDTVAEIQVKVAIAHKIAKFVTWPESRFTAGDTYLRICVQGDARFLDAFQALQDRPVHGRILKVGVAPEPDAVVVSCDVLYLANDERRSAFEWLDAVAGHPVLTIGEAGGYAGDGSIVSMAIRRNKVHFSINLKANADSQLRIGAQLLQLAAAVGTSGHAP